MDNKIEEIENKDLIFKQYDEKTLIFNIERCKLTPNMILIHQKNLSNEFIIEYILNEKYAVFNKDFDITINKVIGLHPNFANFDITKYSNDKQKQ